MATVRDRSDVPYAVRALWQDGDMEVVDVDPLGVDEVAEVLAGVVGRRRSTRDSRPGCTSSPAATRCCCGRRSRAGWPTGRCRSSTVAGRGRVCASRPADWSMRCEARLAAVGEVGIEAGDLLAVGAPLPLAAVAGGRGARRGRGARGGRRGEGRRRRARCASSTPCTGRSSPRLARRRPAASSVGHAGRPAGGLGVDHHRPPAGGPVAARRGRRVAVRAVARGGRGGRPELRSRAGRRAGPAGGGGGRRVARPRWSWSVRCTPPRTTTRLSACCPRWRTRRPTMASDVSMRVAMYLARSARYGFRLDLDEDLRRVEETVEDPGQPPVPAGPTGDAPVLGRRRRGRPGPRRQAPGRARRPRRPRRGGRPGAPRHGHRGRPSASPAAAARRRTTAPRSCRSRSSSSTSCRRARSGVRRP